VGFTVYVNDTGIPVQDVPRPESLWYRQDKLVPENASLATRTTVAPFAMVKLNETARPVELNPPSAR